MSTTILMPALSPTMEHGKLARWLVKTGDSVSPGDVIAEIETDKATMEVETDDGGVVARLVVPEGAENVPVNAPIAVIAEEGETVDADAAVAQAASAPTAQTAETEEAIETPVLPAGGGGDGSGAASSLAGDGMPNPALNLSITPPVETDPEIPEGTEFVDMTVREALRDAMAEEMRSNDRVFLMGEEVAQYQGAYKVSQGLLEEFGDKRVVDTPITEYGFAGLGAGAAFAGLRPIVEFMTFNFAMQAIDQIINSAAKTRYMSGGQMGAHIVFRGPNGAAARVAAQHSQDYAAWYAQIPGLKVAMPYSAADARGLLKSAIRDPNPVIFLENEILYGRSFEVPVLDDFTVPFGRARIWREGSDVTIVSFGIGMTYALEAADELAREGISAEVIDLRSLRPIDYDTLIASVMKTNRCVTVEEGWPVGSIGNHLSATIMQRAFDYLDAPVINCTGKDVPMPYAANLEKLALVTTKEVIDAVKTVTYR